MEERLSRLENLLGEGCENLVPRIQKCNEKLADMSTIITLVEATKLFEDIDDSILNKLDDVLLMGDVYAEKYIPLLQELDECSSVINQDFNFGVLSIFAEIENKHKAYKEEFDALNNRFNSLIMNYSECIMQMSRSLIELDHLNI